MKFTFKMFVLVGLIMVGKYLKENNADGIVQDQKKINQEVLTLKSSTPLPFEKNVNTVVESETEQVNTTDKTFTFRLN